MAVIPFPNVGASFNVRTDLPNTQVFASPFSSAIHSQGLGGDTLQLILTLQNRYGVQRRRLDAFISELSGQTNRALVFDHRYKSPTGSLVVNELLTNADFDNASNWTADAGMAVRSSTMGLRYEHVSGGVGDITPDPDPVTVVAGNAYAFVVDFFQGYQPSESSQQDVKLGTSAGGTQIGSGSTATGETQGRVIASGVATGTSLFASIAPDTSDIGQYQDITRASLSRCLRVNGFNQVGTRLLVKNLDVGVDGQLHAGDQFEIDGHLKTISNDVDGDASGNGVIDFYPPIRTAPIDSAPIILLRPSGTFYLANPQTARRNKPGGFSDYTMDFIEDVIA